MSSTTVRPLPAHNQDMLSRYEKAKMLEQSICLDTLFRNVWAFPNWIGTTNCFWYLKKTANGTEYRYVDAQKTLDRLAFDHEKLASGLGSVADQAVDSTNLSIANLEFKGTTVLFDAFEKRWSFDGETVAALEPQPCLAPWLVSPDGRKAIVAKEHNLWLRHLENDTQQALTSDGVQHNAYGVLPERTALATAFGALSLEFHTEGVWSSDSRYFYTMRMDERDVKDLPVTLYVPQDGTVRPKSVQRKYGLPGDDHIAVYTMVVIDTETGKVQEADYPPVQDSVMWAGPFSGNRAWWSADNSRVYFVDAARHLKSLKVVEFYIKTGATRVLFQEMADTYAELGFEFESNASLMPLPDTDELLWWSERSGFAHLYLYDLKTGKMKNTVTQGDWVVRSILHVDTAAREAFVQIAGREKGKDPYYCEVVCVHMDTGAITVLAADNCDYLAVTQGTLLSLFMSGFNKGFSTDATAVSPTGDYFVVIKTRVDMAPITELRRRDGSLAMIVAETDVSGLPEGWQWPEPVHMLAADGETDIYGVIFRPSDFDPEKTYPVIDVAFTNPFYSAVPKGAFGIDTIVGYFYMSAAALAELGFIVTMIDGRGSVYRSKAFHDHAYGCVERGSDLADHVAGIRQLAETRPFMDIDRVGIMDWGGSYGPVYGMLKYPDFYKVGAVTSVWDPRLLMQGDIYQGPDADYGPSTAAHLADKLEGPLLLIQGMLDNFFHPSGMFQIVDALVKANQDFECLMLPTAGHAWDSNHYGMRRTWDHMVRHLMGAVPPKNFRMSNGSEVLIYGLLDDEKSG